MAEPAQDALLRLAADRGGLVLHSAGRWRLELPTATYEGDTPEDVLRQAGEPVVNTKTTIRC